MTEVGPVLVAGSTTDAVILALRELNPGLRILDQGSYLRVAVPQRCVLRAEAVERHLGHAFRLPVDLESVMCSFKGRLTFTEDSAIWEAPVGHPAGASR